MGSLGERDRQQQALGGDVAIAGLLRDFHDGIEEACRLRREVDLACAVPLYPRQRVESHLGLLQRVFRPSAGSADEIGGEALSVIEKNLEQVLRREALMAARGRKALCRLHEAARALGKLVDIHVPSLVGHPLPRAERGRTLMASCEAHRRMPGIQATASYMGFSSGAARAGTTQFPRAPGARIMRPGKSRIAYMLSAGRGLPRQRGLPFRPLERKGSRLNDLERGREGLDQEA